MTPDCELLNRYGREHSEDAFAELARRHLPLVFRAALRQVNGDRQLAQDVAQNVLIALAREARKFRPETSVTGWLYKTTRFLAVKAVRTEFRRRSREHEVAVRSNSISDLPIDWRKAQIILDQSLEALGETDREVLLLRYGGEHDFKSIAEILSLSEAAARKRVERALGKLRGIFEKRGVTTTDAALGSMLAGGIAASVPADLAASVTQAALHSAWAGLSVISAGSFMTLSKIKTVFACLALLGLGGLALVEHRNNQDLRRRLGTLGEANGQLNGQLAAATNRMTDAEEAMLRSERRDAVRLRAELARLKRTANPAAASAETDAGANDSEPVKSANLSMKVPTGQTLLTGGWEGHSGKRVFVILKPEIAAEKVGTTNQISLRTQWFEVPEEALAHYELSEFAPRAEKNPLGSTMAQDQMETLLARLKESPGIKIETAPDLTVLDGHDGGISESESDDDGRISMIGPIIRLVPNVAADHSGIDLQIEAKFGAAFGSSTRGVWEWKKEL